ncbi:MAG: response regulator [Deltaproteobacteria bacterium]|jgi:putative two-component system response regulator|nr:response regulator [Deltaproteobacteria bacterium]
MAEKRKTIMLVDDNIANLKVGKLALSDKYDVFTVLSAQKMLDLLPRHKPDIILLDVDMPGVDGFEAIKLLKANPATREVPVIFLTAMNDNESELKGLVLGAVDYVAKPFSPPLLRKRIDLHLLIESQKHALQDFNDNLQGMVEAKTKTVLKLQNKLLHTVADLLESRDYFTGSHLERAERTLEILIPKVLANPKYRAEAAGWDVAMVLQSSLLHDVGKIAISDSILKNPGRLTREEFAEMQKHTDYGVKIIDKIADDADVAFLSYARLFAGTHHEKWDGSGYPRHLAGEDIPLLGRLMGIADVYEALTSERTYKSAYPHDKSVAIIMEGKGTHFDPDLADIFFEVSGALNTEM